MRASPPAAYPPGGRPPRDVASLWARAGARVAAAIFRALRATGVCRHGRGLDIWARQGLDASALAPAAATLYDSLRGLSTIAVSADTPGPVWPSLRRRGLGLARRFVCLIPRLMATPRARWPQSGGPVCSHAVHSPPSVMLVMPGETDRADSPRLSAQGCAVSAGYVSRPLRAGRGGEGLHADSTH